MPRSAMATIDKKADTHRAVLGAFMEKFRLAGPRELVLIQPPLVSRLAARSSVCTKSRRLACVIASPRSGPLR